MAIEQPQDAGTEPMDADELMILADRIDVLPPADAAWVQRLQARDATAIMEFNNLTRIIAGV